ncbi:hypothetical protein [Scytonema sp. NUACC21]
MATANHTNCGNLPKISDQLANDTILDGGTKTDGRTSDPTIAGKVSKSGTIVKLLASFEEVRSRCSCLDNFYPSLLMIQTPRSPKICVHN